jgi:VanZ family protein
MKYLTFFVSILRDSSNFYVNLTELTPNIIRIGFFICHFRGTTGLGNLIFLISFRPLISARNSFSSF